MVFNKGFNDLSSSLPSYSVWHSMLRRCYSSVYHANKPTYVGTIVSDEWLLFSNFNKWFVLNNVEGWQLDKDLLFNNSKIYSEETCIFLPNEINCALQTDKGKNGLPSGVSYKTSHGKYVAQLSILDENGHRKNKHLIISDSVDVCKKKYSEEKIKYIMTLAEKHKEKLSEKAYNALLNFKVERE